MNKITNGYYISAVALHENNLLREVEIDSYVGGKKKRVVTSASMDTFCLLSFLKFFSHAEKRRIVRHGAIEYTWLSYQYAIDKNPILKLNNAKIKRHLDILQALDLLDLVSDKGQVYFSLKNYELTELVNHNQSVINNNQGSVVNHNQGAIMNNNSRINNIDRVENIKRIDSSARETALECEVVAPSDSLPLEVKKGVDSMESPKQKRVEYSEEFGEFWSKYPKGTKKQEAFASYTRALSGKSARGKMMPKGLKPTHEMIMQGLERWVSKWKREGTEERFIPDASTWLNGMRYLDELEAPAHLRRGMQGYGYQEEHEMSVSDWAKKYYQAEKRKENFGEYEDIPISKLLGDKF